jgi:hypothetical protein
VTVAATSSPPGADDLLVLAASIGEAWARSHAQELEAQERGAVGAWPGTLREARARVIAALSPTQRDRAMANLDPLARAVYGAARRYWDAISQPDPEP